MKDIMSSFKTLGMRENWGFDNWNLDLKIQMHKSPIIQFLDQNKGIKQGLIDTIHFMWSNALEIKCYIF